MRQVCSTVAEQGIMDFYSALEWLDIKGHKDWVDWLYSHPAAAGWVKEVCKRNYHEWRRGIDSRAMTRTIMRASHKAIDDEGVGSEG